MSLTVQTEQRGDVVVVSIAGELDMATAPQLLDQITDLIDRGRCSIVFDLANLSFCDSTGLSVFVRAKNGCEVIIDPNADLVTIKSKNVTIQSNNVLVQSDTEAPQELATKTFVVDVFDKHVHPSGSGPTGTPSIKSSIC